MPISRLAQETLKVGLLALIFFAIARAVAERFNIPGLRAALGQGGVAQ